MEIKIASEKFNNETAQITLPGRNTTGFWLTKKINLKDVLIYITDMAVKWTWGGQSFQHTERQGKN